MPVWQIPAKMEVIYDDDGKPRNLISAPLLRDNIDAASPEDSAEISGEAITHCVHRIHTQSNKRLATRIKGIST